MEITPDSKPGTVNSFFAWIESPKAMAGNNKAKAISAELLELNFKNNLEETGKKKMKCEETEKLEQKKQRKVEETE